MRNGTPRLLAYARLTRPMNMLLFVVGVVLGGLLTGGADVLEGEMGLRLTLAALSAACIGGAANSFNDYADLDIDRINRPGRPLPLGHATPAEAVRLWMGLTAAGVVLGFVLSPLHGVIALASALLLVLYSTRLKGKPLVGNLIVASLVAAALVYGGLSAGSAEAALVGALLAFLTTLAREIAKDIEDEKGDRAQGARTLPLVWGRRRAAALAKGVTALAFVLVPVPYLLLGYAPLYLLVVLAAAAALLAALVRLHRPTPARACAASTTLKWSMVLGIVALALGAPL